MGARGTNLRVSKRDICLANTNSFVGDSGDRKVIVVNGIRNPLVLNGNFKCRLFKKNNKHNISLTLFFVLGALLDISSRHPWHNLPATC